MATEKAEQLLCFSELNEMNLLIKVELSKSITNHNYLIHNKLVKYDRQRHVYFSKQKKERNCLVTIVIKNFVII